MCFRLRILNTFYIFARTLKLIKMKVLKIEWDETATETQLKTLETLKKHPAFEGVTIELIGKRPNDRE
jgi:hypothetical protein